MAAANDLTFEPGGDSGASWRMSLLASAVTVTVYLVAEYHWGELRAVLAGDDSLGVRAVTTLLLLVCLTPLAQAYHFRWTRANVAALRGRFGLVPDAALPRELSVVAGVIGSALFVTLFFVLPLALAGQTPTATVQFSFAVVAGIAYGWLGARLMTSLVWDSIGLAHLARRIEDLDLLDPGSLAPFVRQGLGSTLLLVLLICLSSHLFVAPGDAAIGSTVMLLITIGTMVLVFVLPMTGVHQLLRRRKAGRLAEVRAEIRPLAQRVTRGEADASACARLEALLALEHRLMGVREWPIDGASWLRFGLFLLLGLGSWIGAAAVERLIDSYF